MRSLKILTIIIIIFIGGSNVLLAQIPSSVEELYFLKIKATQNATQEFSTAQCQSFKEAYPQFDSIKKFQIENKCELKEKTEDDISLICHQADDSTNIYFFSNKNNCTSLLINAQKLITKPDFEKDIHNALSAKWYGFEIHLGPVATECKESIYSNPEDIIKTGACKINGKNSMLISLICSADKQENYLQNFVKGREICEKTRENTLKELSETK